MLDSKHGQVGFYLAPALSGHDCFNAYLKRFKKRDGESCSYCGSLVDDAEHALFFCARWVVAREAVGREVEAQLTPDMMVSLMLQSEQKWILIESFVTVVMKTRELDGRVKRGNSGTSRIRIGACTRFPTSWADLAVCVKFNAERRFRGRCFGSREGFFGFNRYA